MSLRPAQAHWFETYIPREQTVYALDALAGSASVELEADPRFAVPLDLQPVRKCLRRFDELVRPYAEYLPDAGRRQSSVMGSPELIVAKATGYVEQWLLRSVREHGRLRDIEFELRGLDLLEECVQALGEDGQSLPALGHRSEFLYKGVYACPRRLRPEEAIHAPFEAVHLGPSHRFVVVAAPPAGEVPVSAEAAAAGCRRVRVPDWLSGETPVQLVQIRDRRAELRRQLDLSREAIVELDQDPRMIEALANVDLIRWYTEHAQALGKLRSLCHVTGWTSEPDPARLQQRLERADIHSLVRFAEPPPGTTGPVRFRHGRLLRPFEAIVQLWGTPGSTEIDPTGLLAIVIPLLFGYMFPDVGHGLILVALSLVLYRRWPQGRILIPCGISAMVFGVVFGEVLGFEHLIEPLWVRPLEAPLRILVAPVFLGIALVLLGLVLSGVEARWQGELRRWLLTDAALLVLYVSALAAVAIPPALAVTAAAVLWYLLGAGLTSTDPLPRAIAVGAGRLLHGSLELGLNTLSFARVGAFALAHAGLSAAVLEIARGIDHPVLYVVALIIGHAVAVAIETLIVFVQTTRLVLFEFFLRFLRAEGRILRPMLGSDEGSGNRPGT